MEIYSAFSVSILAWLLPSPSKPQTLVYHKPKVQLCSTLSSKYNISVALKIRKVCLFLMCIKFSDVNFCQLEAGNWNMWWPQEIFKVFYGAFSCTTFIVFIVFGVTSTTGRSDYGDFVRNICFSKTWKLSVMLQYLNLNKY